MLRRQDIVAESSDPYYQSVSKKVLFRNYLRVRLLRKFKALGQLLEYFYLSRIEIHGIKFENISIECVLYHLPAI